MREVLITRFGFDPKRVELLIDKPGSSIMPTGANIKRALTNMVEQAEQGDVLFFHYSGHGTLIKPHNSSKKEEAIVPCDFNLITSVDFRQLVNRVPKGATFTILSDSCHSGGLIDKETEQIGPYTIPDDAVTIPTNSYKPKEIPFQSILQYFTSLTNKISTDIGTHLTSADVEIMENGRKPCGPFSNAVQMVLKENSGRDLSNREIVMLARKVLLVEHFNKQHPCLYCSNENADAVFLSPPQKPCP
ncbi:hypothetical protein DH2020_014039 [Rehmannia glutinosa]|uniref:Peptidase C14 caspase domain-containing protein n=1 Tax=Rehmannia glutinosa TaxID=99300 RepID=A0ABR0WW63_REHGL